MADETAKPKPRLVQPAPAPSDGLDIEALWLDPALGDGLTDTVWHRIPVDKPRNFFRVNPDPAYKRRTEIYAHRPEGAVETEYYILGPEMRGKIDEARPCTIVTCIYRDGSPRLWCLMLPRGDEKDNDAWVSARAAARDAMKKWVKLVWKSRAYKTRDAQPGYAPDPDWSKLPSFNALVEAAFGPQGVILDAGHPIYRDLMGDGPAKKDDDDDADDLL
jgi:hypothetical protein